MPKEAVTLATYLFSGEDYDWVMLVETGDRVHLSASQVCTRCTWSGVPAKRGTALVADGFYPVDQPHPARDRWVRAVEVVRKRGRYDGAERTELVLRWIDPVQRPGLEPATLAAEGDPGTVRVRLVGADGGARWEETYQRLPMSLDAYQDCGRILLWHWHRYYRFLDRDDAESLAAEFKLVCDASPPADLAAANRQASQMLYRAARDRGWRKLTAREQERHGLSGQWHRCEEVLAGRATDGDPAGVGEYTRREASHSRPYGRTALREIARREARRIDATAGQYLPDDILADWWQDRGRADFAEALRASA